VATIEANKTALRPIEGRSGIRALRTFKSGEDVKPASCSTPSRVLGTRPLHLGLVL
jgi:hypothetical protein